MTEMFDITRREFIRNSALLSAGTALGHAAILPQDAAPHGAPAYVPAPVFPYGAVYFRKTNPPEKDWARDHQTAAQVGMNIFRHWFMWSAIEVAPGKYDWSDYDRMMDLAAKNGIKVVHRRTGWLCSRMGFPQVRPTPATWGATASSWTAPYRRAAQPAAFPGCASTIPKCRPLPRHSWWRWWNITAIIRRCSATTYGTKAHRSAEIRSACTAIVKPASENCGSGCKLRYGTLEKAARNGTATVTKPGMTSNLPDRSPAIPKASTGFSSASTMPTACSIGESSCFASSILNIASPPTELRELSISLPSASHNEWRSAAAGRYLGLDLDRGADKGDEPWKQYQAVDLVRGGARGKPFWHAEARGWSAVDATAGHRPPERRRPHSRRGRRPHLESRLLCRRGPKAFSIAAGGLSWTGPCSAPLAPFAMDGSVTPRAEMAGRIARWANEHPRLWQSNPVKGDVGLVFIPESEIFNYVQQGDNGFLFPIDSRRLSGFIRFQHPT